MKKPKLLKIMLSVIGFGLALYFIILRPFVINPYKLKNSYKFTVATVVKKKAPAEGEMDAIINYRVNGKLYDAAIGLVHFDYNVSIGNRYFIKFYPGNPSIAKLMYDISVPDTLQQIPPEGWDIIPQ